jgi:hypothetical protein
MGASGRGDRARTGGRGTVSVPCYLGVGIALGFQGAGDGGIRARGPRPYGG